jgi:hypothetical protein
MINESTPIQPIPGPSPEPPNVDNLLITPTPSREDQCENVEPEKPKVGAPPKFSSAEEVQTAIDLYFSKCDENREPYTITGLALALKTNRQTLLNYQQKDEFFYTITNAKQKCENYVEKYLFTGKNTAGAIFNMINNYRGWKNTNDINVGGQADNELKISVSFTNEK